MMTTQAPTLYVIRHGETDWNIESRMQGRRDIPLNTKGRDQAQAVGVLLNWLLPSPLALDFASSPLIRARETMEIVRAQLNLPGEQYRADERLAEISFGTWEGLRWDEIESLYPATFTRWKEDAFNFQFEKGESYAQAMLRLAYFREDLKRDTVLVAHAGIIRTLMSLYGCIPYEQAPHLLIPQGQVLMLRPESFCWLKGSQTPSGN
jgi:probable phosphoglycerate mutase